MCVIEYLAITKEGNFVVEKENTNIYKMGLLMKYK